MQRQPPDEATILFDGRGLGAWLSRNGDPPGWELASGHVTVRPGSGDLLSRELHGDCRLHLEFRLPDMAEAEGQDRANSGVFLQGRYELQILDSSRARIPGTGDCGAVYRQHAPLCNACAPPGQWQSFDAFFRAARERAGDIEPARLTVLHNGMIIHNNVELSGPTGDPLDADPLAPGPLRLQDHGDPVAFRNIWLLALPRAGSAEYQPG